MQYRPYTTYILLNSLYATLQTRDWSKGIYIAILITRKADKNYTLYGHTVLLALTFSNISNSHTACSPSQSQTLIAQNAIVCSCSPERRMSSQRKFCFNLHKQRLKLRFLHKRK